MPLKGEKPDSFAAAQLARHLRSARLRGVIRHHWLNDGVESASDAQPIHWAASVHDANSRRHTLGLPPLNPQDDPAPDVAAEWTRSAPPDSAPTENDELNSAPYSGDIALPLTDLLQWTASGRLLIFVLAAASIGCMLVDTEGAITVRSFFFAVFAPACLALSAVAAINRLKGDGLLFRSVVYGALAGLGGAAIFNLLRLPFVYSVELGLTRLGIPHIPFFNLYPRIGAVFLGEPVQQQTYHLQNYLIGWGYHIIRTAATGIMFAAAIGEIRAGLLVRSARTPFDVRAVLRGALLTVTIQALLLLSPYARLFSIELTPRLVVFILLAHLSFGVSISLFYTWGWGKMRDSAHN